MGQVDVATLNVFTRLSLVISTLGSGDRIVPTLREGVTAEDPEYSHPSSAGPAVPFDRLISVLRARGVVATGAGEEMGKRPLVSTDGSKQQGFQLGSPAAWEPGNELAQVRLDPGKRDLQSGWPGDQHDVEAYSRSAYERIIPEQGEPHRLA